MDITCLGQSSFRIKGKTAIVVVETNASIRVEDREGESPYAIAGPGEFEVKGVGVIGMSIGNHTVYRIEIDGISIVHLGDLDHALTASEVDVLDGVDILMVPVDVGVSVIHEIEPSIAIPMHYSHDELAEFLKEIGKEEVVPQSKFAITKDKIPEQMQVVVLT